MCCAVCGAPALSLQRLGYPWHVVVHAEETAELERRNEELAKDNAVLDTENDKYWGMYSTSPAHGGPWVMGDVLSGLPSTEEVDGLRRRIEELEARLDHSMIPDLQCVCVRALVQLFRLK